MTSLPFKIVAALLIILAPLDCLNAAPQIVWPTAPVTISEEATVSLPFQVQDADTALTALLLSAHSSDQEIIPESGMLFAGLGTNRALILAPVEAGRTEITVSISDGFSSTRRSIPITVTPRANSSPSMFLTAVVTEKPAPSIRLVFPKDPSASQYQLYRKSSSATNWGNLLLLLPGSATGFTDTNVSVGAAYEYRVVKNRSYPAYLYAGIRAKAVENRGTVLLMVDRSFALALQAELARLEDDLIGDGWKVIRHDVSRDDEPSHVKEIIKADYKRNPEGVKSLFLFGHIPIPYSGSYSPDGHHFRGFPADVFYADIDGLWTDELVAWPPPERHETRNYPGDGHYDQSTIPSPVELEAGRVDLFNLPAFLPRTEKDLLRQYLDKDHEYRHGIWKLERRALVDGWAGNSFPNQATMFGASKVFQRPFFPSLSTESYLWASRAQYGHYQGFNDGGGSTADFAASAPQAAFVDLAGSYFGEWDVWDDFLRGALATSGKVLTASYSMPFWRYHHMALGETAGYAAKVTQNNAQRTGLYSVGDANEGRVHIALMGDPTLRLQPVAPVRECTARVRSSPSHQIELHWSEPLDVVEGYHIYRATNRAGPFLRQTSAPIHETSFIDTNPSAATNIYMIRALKFEISASGTYENLSQGIFCTVAAPSALTNGNAVTSSLSTLSHTSSQSDGTSRPSITITEPGPAATVWGHVVVRASLANTSAIDRVEFRVDGKLLATKQQGPFDFIWHTFDLTTGQQTEDSLHQLKLTAYDRLGRNCEETTQVRVDSSLARPMILRNSPTNLTTQAGLVIDLTYNWRGGPMTRNNWLVFTHVVDQAGRSFAVDAYAPSIPTHYWSGSYSYPVKLRINPGLAPGAYKIMTGLYAGGERARLQPGPGVFEDEQRRYQTGVLTIVPDRTPPKIFSFSLQPRQKLAGKVPLSFVAADNVAVQRFDLLVDGQKIASVITASNAPAALESSSFLYTGSHFWNTVDVSNGLHRVTVRAVDPSGNAAEQSADCVVSNVTLLKIEPSQAEARAGDDVNLTYHWSGGPSSFDVLTELISEATRRPVLHLTHVPTPSPETWTGGEVSYPQSISLPREVPAGKYRIVVRLSRRGGTVADSPPIRTGPGVIQLGSDAFVRYEIGTLNIR